VEQQCHCKYRLVHGLADTGGIFCGATQLVCCSWNKGTKFDDMVAAVGCWFDGPLGCIDF
jgi:hypothetical protein